tara:strand:- start:1512 stop:1676 length:165 start_codon:yes stop_codon:yes gene_type:complete
MNTNYSTSHDYEHIATKTVTFKGHKLKRGKVVPTHLIGTLVKAGLAKRHGIPRQ